jgi:hypothetical protein
MKIVVNRCFGGFSLSPLAMKRYAELCGRECYFFTQDIAAGLDSPYIPATVEQLSNERQTLFFSAFDIPNPNEALPQFQSKEWGKMPMEQRKAFNAVWREHTLDQRPDDRKDVRLVQTVEELGDAASGQCAKLKVVEIPDDVDWQIDEYDGQETVREKSREW